MFKEQMNKFRIVLICCLPILLAGCVYTFNPKGKSSIKSIAIERFTNRTGEFGLEDIMTDQIIDAFIADGNLKVVEAEYADALLSGSLTAYERRPYNPDENDVVEDYSIRMYFDIKLTNPVDNTEIWTARINQQGIYNINNEQESDGQQRAITFLVEDIINRTTQSW